MEPDKQGPDCDPREPGTLPNYNRNLMRPGFTEQNITEVSDRVVDDTVLWREVERIVPRVCEHLAPDGAVGDKRGSSLRRSK